MLIFQNEGFFPLMVTNFLIYRPTFQAEKKSHRKKRKMVQLLTSCFLSKARLPGHKPRAYLDRAEGAAAVWVL